MQTDKTFAQNWNLVKDWNEKSRYSTQTQKRAEELISAIADSQSGVLPWLQNYW